MIKMSPLGDRVLIKPKAKEEKSAGGLILAGSSSESLDAALTGTIVAVGDEVEIDVAAGDQVLYTKYGSSDIETDEGNVSFVVEKSILAKLT
jgi:chaperonin GroES